MISLFRYAFSVTKSDKKSGEWDDRGRIRIKLVNDVEQHGL